MINVNRLQTITMATRPIDGGAVAHDRRRLKLSLFSRQLSFGSQSPTRRYFKTSLRVSDVAHDLLAVIHRLLRLLLLSKEVVGVADAVGFVGRAVKGAVGSSLC